MMFHHKRAERPVTERHKRTAGTESLLLCNDPRFRDREDADYVYDNATELTWLKDAHANNGMLDWRGDFYLVEKMNRECK
jgi:hypothetical protein